MEKVSRVYWMIFLILVLFILFFTFLVFEFNKKDKVLTFAMLDIGQGDAIFIESPTGMQILVDAGPPKNILRKLNKFMPFWDRSIDAIIITNPDLDHMGGVLDILKNYKVAMIFEPGTVNDSSTYKKIQQEIKAKDISNILARSGMSIDLGSGARIDFLFPDQDVSTWERNDGSIIARLSYGANNIMLTGDATTVTEREILKNYDKSFLKSDILKVGHHGSFTSTSREFVEAVSPKYALISLGKDNTYGHPHIETLATLKEFGAEILRTDLNGTIVFTCDKIKLCKLK